MSKLSFVDPEYFLAIIVRGHIILNAASTAPSSTTTDTASQVKRFTRLVIPQYKT
ncbi:MAG: hypothetical protein PHT07_17430 [Paludibacter sp.]|nr:hypothetical protein [Paludibacter sp.]